MKIKTLTAVGALVTLSAVFTQAAPLGTAFTYQGHLTDSGAPATGWYALRFTLWNDATRGQVQGEPQIDERVEITNGVFTVLLDFGVDPLGRSYFPGDARWLEIAVDRYRGTNFVTLAPRQPVTPAPYALYAPDAGAAASMPASGLTGTLPDARLSVNVSLLGPSIESAEITDGTIVNADIAPGAAIADTKLATIAAAGKVANSALAASVSLLGQSIESAEITDGTIGAADVNANSFNSTFWRVTGNSGTTAGTHFLGTTDDEPLEFKVNGLRVWRVECANNGLPNIVGGASVNWVAPGVVGATIAGGGFTNIGSMGRSNVIAADFGVIGGGKANRIGQSPSSTIGGGSGNEVQAASDEGTIGGGYYNDIGANSPFSTIGGGYNNAISTNSDSSTISGGVGNDIGTNSPSSSIGGGRANRIGIERDFSFVVGEGEGNAIGGGVGNVIFPAAEGNVIGGGGNNSIWTNATFGAIGGGEHNTIYPNADYATIPGGRNNSATNYAFAAGYKAWALNQGAFVWSDSTGTGTASTASNSVTFRASGGYRFFTGTGGSGAQLLAGATAWSVLSDRNRKQDIQPVDGQLILDKLSRVPVAQWHYDWETAADPLNLGPMAQDFKAAFYPGRDDTSISTLEFDGVALAAIQGLNEIVKEKETRIAELERGMAELKALVKTLAEQVHGGGQ